MDSKEYQRQYYIKNRAKKIEATRLWKLANPEKAKQAVEKCHSDPVKKEYYDKKRKESYRLNPEPAKARAKEWAEKYGSLPEVKLKRKERAKKWREETKDKRTEYTNNYYAANKEKRAKYVSLWASENKEKKCASSNKRRSAILNRTPKWVDDDELWVIKEAYSLALLREKFTGIKWHVDHYLPLQGRKVSGLHTMYNLQVIPASQNSRKHNKMIGEKQSSFF
jgi:hypothetical protein